jgi:hypothetical protein
MQLLRGLDAGGICRLGLLHVLGIHAIEIAAKSNGGEVEIAYGGGGAGERLREDTTTRQSPAQVGRVYLKPPAALQITTIML